MLAVDSGLIGAYAAIGILGIVFLPFIFLYILGCGGAEYRGAAAARG
jgi:hypothetical protein